MKFKLESIPKDHQQPLPEDTLLINYNASYLQQPWSMITDNRIFSLNFAVYGRLR